MICHCYLCGDMYGEKEPLKDHSITSGICPICWPGELKKLRKYRRDRAEEKRMEMERLALKSTSEASDQDKPDHQ
jgi:hypothetical protein